MATGGAHIHFISGNTGGPDNNTHPSENRVPSYLIQNYIVAKVTTAGLT